MKLSEKVQELKRLSKLNETPISEEVLAAGVALGMEELVEHSVVSATKVKKKAKKKRKKSKGGDIEYSRSALELLGRLSSFCFFSTNVFPISHSVGIQMIH